MTAEEAANYQVLIRRKIVAHWSVKGNTSRPAVVVFKINPDGLLPILKLHTTSGNAVSDQAAMKAVRDSVPFPPFPQGVNESVDVMFTFDPRALTKWSETERVKLRPREQLYLERSKNTLRLKQAELKSKHSAEVANILMELGQISLDLSDYSSAQPLFKRAVSIREKIGPQKSLAEALTKAGESYQHEPQVAIPLLRRAISIGEVTGADCLKKGMELCMEALFDTRQLSEWQKLSDRYIQKWPNNGVNQIKNNRADIKVRIEESLKHLTAQEATNDEAGVARTLLEIGERYKALGSYDEALPFLTRSVTISAKQAQLKEILVDALFQKGETLYLAGRFADSEQVLQQAIETITDKSMNKQYRVYKLYGNVLYKLNRVAEANKIFEELKKN